MPAMPASSSSEPPQRSRVTSRRPLDGSPTTVQLATIGRSRTAAAWASTSLPTSVPVATTVSGASDAHGLGERVAPRLGAVVGEQLVVAPGARRRRRRTAPSSVGEPSAARADRRGRAPASPSVRANVNASSVGRRRSSRGRARRAPGSRRSSQHAELASSRSTTRRRGVGGPWPRITVVRSACSAGGAGATHR